MQIIAFLSSWWRAIIGTNAGLLIIGNKFHWNLIQNITIYKQWNKFQNIVCLMVTILPQTQCVKHVGLRKFSSHFLSSHANIQTYQHNLSYSSETFSSKFHLGSFPLRYIGKSLSNERYVYIHICGSEFLNLLNSIAINNKVRKSVA